MNKVTLKERLQYWFDKQMAKGSMSLIKLLSVATILVILLVTLIASVLGFYEDGFLSVLWDSIATIVNSWLPYYEDGSGSIPYLILMSFAALSGLLVTSILIGIISSAIEEKVTSLKQGNSRVLESGHYVVLGFTPGEYTLIRQLILAAAGTDRCIVVGDAMDQEEMVGYINDNIDIPQSVQIICRSIDIFDPVSLQKLSLDTCKTIIISPTDDKTTAKILLAVSRIINDSDNANVRVGAIMSNKEYRFPESVAKKHNVTTFHTNEVIAKIIAHSCTQPGLSDTFREIFNFEGSELYDLEFPKSIGLTFAQLSYTMDQGTPVGIIRDKGIIINPDVDMKIEEGDHILTFAEDRFRPYIQPLHEMMEIDEKSCKAHHSNKVGKIVILGYNESFETVIHELPDNVTEITSEAKPKYRDTINTIGNAQKKVCIEVFDKDINEEGALFAIVKDAAHVVLLSDHELDDEDADMKVIFRIMHLRDLRSRYGLQYNITAEMRKDANLNLIKEDDHIDFVVSSNMSSLILAQVAESPELMDAFNELISIEGNEFYLKTARELNCCGRHTARELRQITLMQNYVFMGYIPSLEENSIFNPALDEVIDLAEEDIMIVIGLEE